MSKLVTVKEYAKLFDMSLGTVYKYIRIGKLQYRQKNGKKYVVLEEDSNLEKQQIEVIQNPELKIEIENEVEILKARIRELENYMQLCQKMLKNNEQDSLPPVVEVDLMDYLINLGFTKKIRKKIHERCLEKDEPRFRKENGKIFLNPAKFDYEDILKF